MLSVARAAEIFQHYIEVALSAGGVQVTPDMRAEMNDAVAAFHDAAQRIDAAGKVK